MRRTGIILLVLLMATGIGRAEQVWDDEDVRGPFDLKWFAQDRREGDALRFRLITHEPFTVNDVKRGGFAIRVDSDPDDDYERFALIEWKDSSGPGGDLRARVTKPDGTVVDRRPVRHPTGTKLIVWLDRRKLGVEKGGFKVNAYSILYADYCPDDGCRDPVPDEGRMTVGFGGRCTTREPDITGTPDDDKIETRGRKVVVAGLGGDDVIRVERGSVIACGDAGADVLIGGDRTDRLYGGSGADDLRMNGAGQRPNQGYGGRGNDLLFGGRDRDRLFGQANDDYLEGRAGNDHLDGGGGNDDLSGGSGTDTCLNGRRLGGC